MTVPQVTLGGPIGTPTPKTLGGSHPMLTAEAMEPQEVCEPSPVRQGQPEMPAQTVCLEQETRGPSARAPTQLSSPPGMFLSC